MFLGLVVVFFCSVEFLQYFEILWKMSSGVWQSSKALAIHFYGLIYLYGYYSSWQSAADIFGSILGHVVNENHGTNIVTCQSRQKSIKH